MRSNLTPEQRFLTHIDPCRTDGCIIWVGTIDAYGYGVFKLDGKNVKAHRFAYGDIPEGMTLDHVRERGCFNKACVCREHLEPVTASVNRQRARAEYCKRGHAKVEGNLYFDKDGRYHCRACKLKHP